MNSNYERVKAWRKKTQKPCACGRMIGKYSKHCRHCRPRNLADDLTLLQAKYDKHHRSSAWALVRWRARSLCEKLPQVCYNCGYDKHVEVCHIKAIASYSPDTLVSTVNSVDNLVLLCPNCHWEFDNGLLTL